MKTLIIYASKHGATKKCAMHIQKNHNDAALYNINDSIDLTPSSYDKIIIGSPIYAGLLNKKIKQWLVEHESTWTKKDTSLFICGMNDKSTDDVINNNLSDFQKNNLSTHFVGGAYDFKDMNFFERFIVKKVAKATTSIEKINYDMLNTI
jgi:menaquinone-dependent protoporphyrinogen oxidase